jgi:phosphate uptake regulator
VDKAGTSVLIRFQPLASDFRTVLATVKLGSHLENISDQAVDIARRIRALIQESALEEDAGLTSLRIAREVAVSDLVRLERPNDMIAVIPIEHFEHLNMLAEKALQIA